MNLSVEDWNKLIMYVRSLDERIAELEAREGAE